MHGLHRKVFGLKRWLVWFIAALALCGCAKATENGHVLRLADGPGYPMLNPYFQNGDWGAEGLWELTGASLAGWAATSDTFRPILLRELPTRANGGISPDFRRFVLHLRSNLHWSDGAALTSRDVVFTYHAVMDPSSGVTSTEGWNALQTISAPNPMTVVMSLRVPDAGFLQLLCIDMRFILPEHLLAGAPLNHATKYNRMPIGAGPFRYAKVDPAAEVVLEPNPLYFLGPPKLKQIVERSIPDDNTKIIQMRTGELDMIAHISPRNVLAARTIPAASVGALGTYASLRIVFDLRSPLVQEPAVREALRLGVNRPAIRDKVFDGAARLLESIFVVDDAMHVTLPFAAYDPARARLMLDRAGWRRGRDGIREKNGKKLVIDLLAKTGDQGTDETIELLRENWLRIGVGLNVRRVLEAQLNEEVWETGGIHALPFDGALLSYGSASLDAKFQWGCDTFPPNGFNVARYCDRRVDKLLASLTRIDGHANRLRVFARMQQIINSAVPQIVLVQPETIFVIGSHVHGIYLNAWSIYDHFSNVDIF